MDLFSPAYSTENDSQAIERIFGERKSDINDYCEDTSLQRAQRNICSAETARLRHGLHKKAVGCKNTSCVLQRHMQSKYYYKRSTRKGNYRNEKDDIMECKRTARRSRAFKEVFDSLDADIFCIQETKLQEGQIDLEFDGYKSYWNYAEKKAMRAQRYSQKRNQKTYFTA